jgi:hypothetical protein
LATQVGDEGPAAAVASDLAQLHGGGIPQVDAERAAPARLAALEGEPAQVDAPPVGR